MIHHNLGHSIGYWLLDQTFYRLKCKWFREWTRIEGHDTTLYNTVICNYTFRAFSCEIASDLDLEHRCGFHTPFRCLLTTLPINIEDKNLWRHFSDCISELRWSWTCLNNVIIYMSRVESFLWNRICPNVSATPITAIGCQKCLPFSVVHTVVKWGHTEGIPREKTSSEKYTVFSL